MDEYGYIKYAWLISELSMILVALAFFNNLSLGAQVLEGVYIAGAVASGISIYDKLIHED